MVGAAADHHAVDPCAEQGRHLLDGSHPSVQGEFEPRVLGDQSVDPVVAQRRDRAVLRRVEPEDGLARVHDELGHAGGGHGLDELRQLLPRVASVHAEPTLDGDRGRRRRRRWGLARGRRGRRRHVVRLARLACRVLHRLPDGDAARGDALGLEHEPHAVAVARAALGRGWAATVQVDLVVPERGAEPRRARQVGRLGAAQLQHDRMLLLREPEERGERARRVDVLRVLGLRTTIVQDRSAEEEARVGAWSGHTAVHCVCTVACAHLSHVISDQTTGKGDTQRIIMRKCRSDTSIIGATCSFAFAMAGILSAVARRRHACVP